MKYILNGLFFQHGGKPFLLSDEEQDVPEHQATDGEMLALVLRIYDENHNRFVRDGKLLSPTEIGAFNRLLPLLEHAGPVIALETGDFALLVKVAGWAVPSSPAWRDTPGILEVLQTASSLPPLRQASDQSSNPNGHVPSVPQGFEALS